MATTISFSIQKGGASKTTTSAIIAYMLSQQGRVLCVDMDSQGNLSELLTGVRDLEEFRGQTVLEAIKEGDARNYIVGVTDNLHVLPADDFLATFPRYIYQEFKGKENPSALLRAALEPVQDFYDWIIIDTPPALSEATINALTASDYVVILFETSRFCYSAIKNFIGTVQNVQTLVNPKLEVAGILRSIIDSRRKDARELIDLVTEQYGETVHIFDTIITRSAHVGRLSLWGLKDNPEISKVLDDFQSVYEELIERVSK